VKPASRLQSIDQFPSVTTAVEQTLIVLLECGPAFSVLSASHVSSEPDNGAIVLEDCAQLRIEADGTCLTRNFPQV